jgi:hypothetical protein
MMMMMMMMMVIRTFRGVARLACSNSELASEQ